MLSLLGAGELGEVLLLLVVVGGAGVGGYVNIVNLAGGDSDV